MIRRGMFRVSSDSVLTRMSFQGWEHQTIAERTTSAHYLGRVAMDIGWFLIINTILFQIVAGTKIDRVACCSTVPSRLLRNSCTHVSLSCLKSKRTTLLSTHLGIGIIVDTFAEIREEHNARLEDLFNNCFICGLVRAFGILTCSHPKILRTRKCHPDRLCFNNMHWLTVLLYLFDGSQRVIWNRILKEKETLKRESGKSEQGSIITSHKNITCL